MSSDTKIIAAWRKNVAPWTEAIRNQHIASRVLCTNQAIIDTVLAYLSSTGPTTVLDLGCGEGWLAHTLSKYGIQALGVDVVPELIAAAREQNPHSNHCAFQLLSYDDIAQGALKQPFDIVVSNFALLGKESVDQLFSSVGQLLNPGGYFIIQTLHPVLACADQAYQDSWREGNWAGFSDAFCDPAPWYFRTLQSWIKLYTQNQLTLCELREPLHPETGQPASVIFIGQI